MIFRARLTRAARGTLCALVALAMAWAINAEAGYDGIDNTLRTIALVPTSIFEVALLVGLWRLWVVCLIVDETAVIVRNFRGDIPVRRVEIRGVFPVLGFFGCHVGLRLKTGDELHLEGLAFARPGRTAQAVNEISEALGLAPLEPAS